MRGKQKPRSSPLALEQGTRRKSAPSVWALGYPAPYSVGIASLGAQQVYRLLNEIPGVSCERFYADDLDTRTCPATLESGLRPGDAAAVAFSVACETELAIVAALLEASGLAALAAQRVERDPPVIIGGPLTLIDPRLVAPLADLVVVGDAEPSLESLARAISQASNKADLLANLPPNLPGLWPPHSQPHPPTRAVADLASLPAAAAVWTPQSELRDLFLVEAARGCARSCAFCVMSGRATGAVGFRPIPPQRILASVPESAPGVGLVGAAVTDHESIVEIVRALVARGKRVSLSSIRADRLSDELARALVSGGARSLTLAADGSSERLRRSVHKGINASQLHQAAAVAAAAGFKSLKLYSMVGLPGETQDDIDEFAELCLELNQTLRLSLAVQPFVPKPGTPLADATMELPAVLRDRLHLLERRLRGRLKLSSSSPRWAALDYALAHLEERAALVAVRAAQGGRSFAAWREALAEIAPDTLCTLRI